MDIRKLLAVPFLAGALALGACGGEEEAEFGEEGIGVAEEDAGLGVGVGEDAGMMGEEGAIGGTEILGNGIDDDADGLIDEES